MIKCLETFGNFLEFVVCEGLRRATEPFYTGARQQPQNLSFMSISKIENPCFHVDRHGMSP